MTTVYKGVQKKRYSQTAYNKRYPAKIRKYLSCRLSRLIYKEGNFFPLIIRYFSNFLCAMRRSGATNILLTIFHTNDHSSIAEHSILRCCNFVIRRTFTLKCAQLEILIPIYYVRKAA